MAASIQQLSRRVFDGFGFSVRSDSLSAKPMSADELAWYFQLARKEERKVALRGSGRSYGDAALNGGQVVLDMTGMDRILSWDPVTGIAEVEPGVTIEKLWRSTLKDGYWPAVVPGTMFPTLGGCAAMNIHGKNHFKVGGTGDQILEVDLVTPTGQILTLSRTQEPELFHAAIAGFGMLGAFSRIKIKLKKVEGGRLSVGLHSARSLDEQFALFDQHTPGDDYYVTWVDCTAGGSGLGRGTAHSAFYTHGEDPAKGGDPDGKYWLDPTHQDLPGHIFGVPKSQVWRVLALFTWNGGMRFMNEVKFRLEQVMNGRKHLQGHAGFAFLLDYVPGWRNLYAPHGFIQYQPFVPKETALPTFRKILQMQQAAGMPSYLGVMKRHRADDFLLSHAVDGYSFAMDFALTASNREALWRLCHEMTEVVLEAGGRFYPAKDSVLRPQDFQRAWGQDRITQFRKLRAEVDPRRILQSEWSRRVGVD